MQGQYNTGQPRAVKGSGDSLMPRTFWPFKPRPLHMCHIEHSTKKKAEKITYYY